MKLRYKIPAGMSMVFGTELFLTHIPTWRYVFMIGSYLVGYLFMDIGARNY